jgi:U3 small nucleolar ribonucleoprotein protein IMP4
MQARRNARARKEFLYRKSLEGRDREEYERRQKLKRQIELGEKIPKEMRGEEKALRREMAIAGGQEAVQRKVQDDEYQNAGIEDPKLFLTTSSDPSSRLASFAKELKLILPNCTRVNRGHMSIGDMVEMCRANNVTDMLIVHETRGEPDGLIVSHLPYGPTAYFALYNTVLRHDINPKKKMTLAFPHLVFHNFGTPLGERVQTILKNLFPPPKEDLGRTITFFNENDFISFRHHRTDKANYKTIELEEMGPRFEMRLFRIRLGALDQPEAKAEWELRPYMNSAKRRKFLGKE